MVVCHHVKLTVVLRQVLLVLFGQLSESDEELLLVSLENLQVRINELGDLLLGEGVLELLELHPLLLLLAVLVQSVELAVVELEEEVVGVDEALVVPICVFVLLAVHLGEAGSTLDSAAVGELSPVVDDALLEHEEDDDEEVHDGEYSDMGLTQSLLAEVLGVVSEPWGDYCGPENCLVREHDEAEESVDEHGERKHLDDAGGQELGELRCLSVEVEDEPFVDPELDEEDHEGEGVKCWHAGRVGESREDGGQELRVSHMKDPFRACVEVLVFTLDDLAGLLGVPGEPSVRTSAETEEDRLEERENVGEDEHCSLGESDGSSDSEVPSAVEFVKWSNKEVHLAVLKPKLLGLNETVHGKEDNDRGVNVLGEENGEGDSLIIGRAVLFPLLLHDLLQDHSDEDVADSDPRTNGWTGEIALDEHVVPVFAVLLAISENDLESSLSVLIEDVLAVAIHLADLVFIWLLVVEQGNIDVTRAILFIIASY